MRNANAKAVRCIEDRDEEPEAGDLDTFEASPASSQIDSMDLSDRPQNGPPILRAPDPLTAAKQIIATVNLPEGCDDELKSQFYDDALALYAALDPKDPIGSALSRLLVGATSASMESIARAANERQSPEARAIEMRCANKGTQMVLEIVRALDRYNGRGQQNVKVAHVKVEAGGNAIVGNVTSRAFTEPSSSDDGEE